MRSLLTLLLLSTVAFAEAPKTHDITIGEHTFTLPVGFVIEKVTDSTRVPRPVNACLGKDGELYVTDSSGSNAKPADQLKNPTHRVLKLESSKKNGTYDKVSVFADKLSFLQGILVQKDWVLVSTPPTIQKLTDTDGDGVADKREVWFDGGVLTGCANDVHGPYAGPYGRIYFTKGGFGEQKLKLGTGKEFKTRAAHIYSAKPDGTDLRVEMTGGMDNPVDVAFNNSGELFFTCTFLQHPANGKRDGIIHNTYGALYGKDHNVLDDHPWCDTKLTEPMTHLGPAAPSGLHCYLGGTFGRKYENNLFAAQFNLAKVSRHVLKPKGSTFETIDSDFVTSSNRDFHPTDVIQDHDGSLLIVDTGGWYKHCCPSSVFEKKDILGAVYRLRKEEPSDRVFIAPVVKTNMFGEFEGFGKGMLYLGVARSHPNDAILMAGQVQLMIGINHEAGIVYDIEHNKDLLPLEKRNELLALHALQKDKLQAKLVLPFLDDKDARLSDALCRGTRASAERPPARRLCRSCRADPGRPLCPGQFGGRRAGCRLSFRSDPARHRALWRRAGPRWHPAGARRGAVGTHPATAHRGCRRQHRLWRDLHRAARPAHRRGGGRLCRWLCALAVECRRSAGRRCALPGRRADIDGHGRVRCQRRTATGGRRFPRFGFRSRCHRCCRGAQRI